MTHMREASVRQMPDFDGLFREPSVATGVELSIKGLGKSFGAKQILRGLDLFIPAGQFVAADAARVLCCVSLPGSTNLPAVQFGSAGRKRLLRAIIPSG